MNGQSFVPGIDTGVERCKADILLDGRDLTYDLTGDEAPSTIGWSVEGPPCPKLKALESTQDRIRRALQETVGDQLLAGRAGHGSQTRGGSS